MSIKDRWAQLSLEYIHKGERTQREVLATFGVMKESSALYRLARFYFLIAQIYDMLGSL